MERFFASEDEDFCSICGSILPLPTFAPSKLKCEGCGCEWTVKEKKREVVYVREKIYEKTVLESTAPTEIEEGSSVEHVCSKCEFTQATYSTLQTRSADEGQTVFYTCLKCNNRDIEYS